MTAGEPRPSSATTADPILAFVRREGDEAIACVFNMSAEPRFLEEPALEGAVLLMVRAGDADLRGGSIGLSAWAAVLPATI